MPENETATRADTFGARVKRRRLRAGMSQTDVAREAGVAPETISRIESDEPRYSNPQLDRIQAIARSLGCRAAALVPDGEPI